MARKTTTSRIQTTSTDRSRARGAQRSMQMREGYDDLEDSFSWEPQAGAAPGQEDLGRDDEADGDSLQSDVEDDVSATTAAEEEDTRAAQRLTEVIGSRPPVVLVRLLLEGEKVRAQCTAQPRSVNAREALEELRLFVEHRFNEGRAALSASEWNQLLGQTPVTTAERLLLLTRLAIGGNTKVVIEQTAGEDAGGSERYQFTPHDRGLERYVSKFASLPDGAPFSLRLLLADNRGKKKGNEEATSPWGQLPWALRLEAVRRILAAEERQGEASDDDTFRSKIQGELAAMGLDLAKPSWDDVKNLRESLKRKGLGHLFPNARERQKAYHEKSVKTASAGEESA